MSFVKYDFLNWRPDLEDERHDGLTTADNFLHDIEGYKQLLKQTAGAFSTTSPMNAGADNILSLKAKPFGLSGDLALADVLDDSANIVLRIGVQGQNAFTTTNIATSNGLQTGGSAVIKSFSICEFGQSVVMAAQAQASLLSGGVTTLALGGTMLYTLSSV
jgi:hypothetical protein